MYTSTKKTTHGFTLVETLVAIFVLTMSIGALLSLAANGFYSVKYARNQIVANNLMQEALEFVRNSRDTASEQGLSWDDWQKTVLDVDREGNPASSGQGCFSVEGCMVDPYTLSPKIRQCEDLCDSIVFFSNSSFYGYGSINVNGSTVDIDYPPTINKDGSYRTSFIRQIKTVLSEDGTQITVTATMEWLNGETKKTISQSMVLSKWRQ